MRKNIYKSIRKNKFKNIGDLSIRILTDLEYKICSLNQSTKVEYCDHTHTIFHTNEWNNIVQNIFGTELIYVIAEEKSTLISWMPVHLIKENIFYINAYSPPTMFEMPYGGICFERPLPDEIKKKILNEFSELIVNLFAGIAFSFTTQPGSIYVQPISAKKVHMLETAYMDISLNQEDIWKSLNSKRRNMIRKAKKNDLKIIRGGTELIETYYKMIIFLSRKTGIVLLPFEYYRKVVECFSPSENAQIFLAKKNERYLSGGIFLRYGKMGYYWHGASFPNIENLGQNELIQWEVIKWLKKAGCNTYDLVRIDRERLPNIASFKLDFAKTIVNFNDIYCVSLTNSLLRKISYLLSTRKIIKRLKHASSKI